MACVFTEGKDKEKSDDGRSSGVSDTEQYGATQETSSRLSRRWQNSFAYTFVDEDFNSPPCTHATFVKASKRHESLGGSQRLFDGVGELRYEVFDLLAEKYEECLNGGDLDFEKLQTTRFTDSLVESPSIGISEFGHAIEGEDVSGAAEDSRYEIASVSSVSDSSSDASHVSVVSDMVDEVQVDIEEALERLLVKRRTLQKEKPLTDEDELVLESAWRLFQAIVYHDIPRQSLKDIAEQGNGWFTAPGTPFGSELGANSSGSSHYSTAGSI